MQFIKPKTRLFTFASAVGLTIALGSIGLASAAESSAQLNLIKNPPVIAKASLLRIGNCYVYIQTSTGWIRRQVRCP